jgi:hypothetical protein
MGKDGKEKKKTINPNPSPIASDSNLPVKESNYRTEEIKKSLTAEKIEPYAGLIVDKKAKYYSHPNLQMKNRWGAAFDKSQAVKQALVELILCGFSFDTKKFKIGMRLIRDTKQFEETYTWEEKTELKTVGRTIEEKLDEETATTGIECFADYMVLGTERKTEKVKIKGVKGKNILIETARGLEFTKVGNLYSTALSQKEVRKAVGKIKSKVYRFLGIDFLSSKPQVNPLIKNKIYVVKGTFALCKINSKVQKIAESESCFSAYSGEERIEIPGRIIVKFTEDGNIAFYALIEKMPSEQGLKKSFALFEFFKPAPKKEKKEIDMTSKIMSVFGEDMATDEEKPVED